MMLGDITDWAGHHLHVILATTANGFAWAQSASTGNLSVGTFVTICTVAVPAVGGAVIYTIKTVGPVWLKFIEDRDSMRSKSMAGSMDRLSKALEDQTRQAEANKQLAETAAKQADRLQAMLEMSEKRAAEAGLRMAEQTELIRSLDAKIDESGERIEDANSKLHAALGELAKQRAQADLAEATAHDLQVKLDDAVGQINRNSNAIHTQEEVKAFGAKVAQAAHDLAHHESPDGTPATPHGGPPAPPVS